MKINKKHLALAMILLVFCWVGNVICYEKHVLKQPIFLKHYYDIPQGMNQLRLFYIEDLSSQNKITSICFPEIGQQQVNFSESDWNNDRRYYRMKTIAINLFTGPMEVMPVQYKNKIITKAEIKFSSGKTMQVNLGKIYLYNDGLQHRDFDFKSTSSSSDGMGSIEFTAKKDVKVTGIDSSFQEETKDIFQINVNGHAISNLDFPIELKKGDSFSIGSGFDFAKAPIKRNNVYNFVVNILTEDSAGNKGNTSCFVNTCPQSPETFDMKALKSARGRN